MTSPQPQDWQSWFRNLKTGFDSVKQAISDKSASGSETLNQIDVDYPNNLGLETLQQSYQQAVNWFNTIPASGKLLAIAGGGLLSLTLIKTVFQLITSLITLSAFGVILYLVYRFWILPKNSES
jgi:hypothetical protein